VSTPFLAGQIVVVFPRRNPAEFRCAEVLRPWSPDRVWVQGERYSFDDLTGIENCRGFRKRAIAIATPEQLAAHGMKLSARAVSEERAFACGRVQAWIYRAMRGEVPIEDVRRVARMVGGGP
jgi:hypothetical protein